MEKVEVSAFSVQEFIISGIYLYETRKILKTSREFAEQRSQRVMWRLIYINVAIILMDIAVLVLQYMDLYDVQVMFKDAVYSLKLKLEFVILNQLKDAASGWSLQSENLSVPRHADHSDHSDHADKHGVMPVTDVAT